MPGEEETRLTRSLSSKPLKVRRPLTVVVASAWKVRVKSVALSVPSALLKL